MSEPKRAKFNEVAFEYVERIGHAHSRSVYGVDKRIGLTPEPRYQSRNLSRYKRIERGMFAYNPMRLNIGSIGFCSEDHEPGIVSPDYVVFGCKEGKLLPKFLYYHTKTAPWADWLSLAGEGSVRERIYFRKLAQYELMLPDVEHQAAAIQVLGAFDQKIELNRLTNEALEAMAQAIFRDWFVDFGPVRRKLAGERDPVAIMGGLASDPAKATRLAALFPDALTDEGLPNGWRRGRAADLVEFNPTEPMKKGEHAPYSDMASLPTLGSIAEQPVLRLFGSGMRFRNGDALLARITPCLENGKAAFVDFLSADKPVGWGSTEFIVMRARPNVPKPLTYLLARDDAFRQHAIRTMTGTSGRQRAQLDTLEAWEMALGSPAVLDELGAFIVPVFDLISHTGAEGRALADTRDFLLPGLMSGKVRIADAEAEIAA